MLMTHSVFWKSNRRKTFNNTSIQFVATHNSPRKKKLNPLYLFLIFLFPVRITLPPPQYTRNPPTLTVTNTILHTTSNSRTWLSLIAFTTEFLSTSHTPLNARKLEKMLATPSKLTVTPTNILTLQKPDICLNHLLSSVIHHFPTFKVLRKRLEEF